MVSESGAHRGLARGVLSGAMNSEDAAIENLTCATKAPSEAWAVVIYFYAMVHAVNYHRYGNAQIPSAFKHPERNQHVMLKLPNMDAKYRALGKLAHAARYHAHAWPISARDAAKAKQLAGDVCRGAGITVPVGLG